MDFFEKFRYGSERPPEYDLKLIKARVHIFDGGKDVYSSKKGIEKLKRELVNCDVELTRKEEYSHISYILGIENEKNFKNFLVE